MIPFSAIGESTCVAMGGIDEDSRAKYAAETGFKSIITRIIKSGFRVLRLGHYFTAGETEVR